MTDWTKYEGVELPSLAELGPALARLGDDYRERDTYRALVAERNHLADLLDGVMQDDPQAIRDAAAWLATNRPEQETA